MICWCFSRKIIFSVSLMACIHWARFWAVPDERWPTWKKHGGIFDPKTVVLYHPGRERYGLPAEDNLGQNSQNAKTQKWHTDQRDSGAKPKCNSFLLYYLINHYSCADGWCTLMMVYSCILTCILYISYDSVGIIVVQSTYISCHSQVY